MKAEQKNKNKECITTRLKLTPQWNELIDLKIQEEIHHSGEFEFYFGIQETEERLKKLTINDELFYSIYQRTDDKLIGYLGISERLDSWEPEIYIFREFRNHGYGAEALTALLHEVFFGKLVVFEKGKKKTIQIDSVEATVRRENIVSQRMLEKVGFVKNEEVVEWLAFVSEDELTGADSDFMPIVSYSLTKQKLAILQEGLL